MKSFHCKRKIYIGQKQGKIRYLNDIEFNYLISYIHIFFSYNFKYRKSLVFE